jgi:hypothetical protein
MEIPIRTTCTSNCMVSKSWNELSTLIVLSFDANFIAKTLIIHLTEEIQKSVWWKENIYGTLPGRLLAEESVGI